MMFYDRWNPITAWSTFATYRQECERGLVHSPEWVKQMEELETSLRKTQEDLAVIRSANVARDEIARGDFPEAVAR